MSEKPFKDEEVLFQCGIPPVSEQQQRAWNMADEYVVLNWPEGICGITTLGRFGSVSWQNPWHDLPIIRALIDELTAAKQEQKKYFDFWDGLKMWLTQEDVGISRDGPYYAEQVTRQTTIRSVLRHMIESEKIYPAQPQPQPADGGKE